MEDTTSRRLGKFLLIVGLLLMVAFFATDHARSPEFGLFLAGAACLGLGWLLVLRNRQPPPQTSDRFRSARRISKGIARWRARRKEKAAQKMIQKRTL